MHTCRYCKFFNEIENKFRRKEVRDKKTYHFRFCRKEMHDVQGTTEPCESFRPYPFFWCDADDNRMHILACLNRDCDCSQKDDVLDSIRGFDLTKEFNMKPRLVLKQIEQPKPKLKLRKKKIILIPKKPKLKLKKKTNLIPLRKKK